jgi:type IX secretion system PorP/SprF family membrane protein
MNRRPTSTPRPWLAAAIAAAALTAPAAATAQVDAQLSQYYAVQSYYNPGAIGTGDLLNIKGGTRMQWVGIDDAPQTFLLTAEMPFKLLNKRWGVGLLMQQESLGLYSNLEIGAQVAYKLKLLKGTLSIGLQLGVVDEKFKGSEVYIPDDDDYHESSDDAIPTTDIGGTAFDMGIGLHYTHRLFWAGLSLTHVTSPVITMNAESGESGTESSYEFQAGRVLYFMAGSNIPVKNTLFEVMPSMMFKCDFQFWTAEVDARVRYNKFLTAGVGYRYNDAVKASLAAEYKGFYVGYSYDYPISDIAKASTGSHEIFAGYSMKLDLSEKNKNKHKSIRIM